MLFIDDLLRVFDIEYWQNTIALSLFWNLYAFKSKAALKMQKKCYFEKQLQNSPLSLIYM